MAFGSQQSHQSRDVQDGPPFPPQYQSLGQIPSILPDVPINGVFLSLFLVAALSHVIIFRKNMADGRKFPISIVIAVFCAIRVVGTALRIAWAFYPARLGVGIAATVFIYAGIVLLFLVDLVFAERLVKAQHPVFGWSNPFRSFIIALFVTTIASILCTIAAVIINFYTLGSYPRHVARKMQECGTTLLAVVAFAPLTIVGISSLARRLKMIRMTKTIDKFGDGSMSAKVAIVLVSATWLSVGASFRAATTLLHPVLTTEATDPPTPAPKPWYLSKACFYVFNFAIELCLVVFWLIMRVDKRFYIPDGAQGPFSYAGGFVFAGESGNERKRISQQPDSQQHLSRPVSQNISRPVSQNVSRPVSQSSRASWTGSRRSSKAIHQAKIANRVSWGGVSIEVVQPGLGEDRKEIPYPAFAQSGRYGESAADVGIEGVEKEMGWDPGSGKWALRPISRRFSIDSDD